MQRGVEVVVPPKQLVLCRGAFRLVGAAVEQRVVGMVMEMNKRASGGHKQSLKTSRWKIQSKDLKNFSKYVRSAEIEG